MPEIARKHLQSLKELREQLEHTKKQTDAVIQQVEDELRREPDNVKYLCADDRPRRKR